MTQSRNRPINYFHVPISFRVSVMRLGKKKEKDRDGEKEQCIDGVARLICSAKQSHPVPLRGELWASKNKTLQPLTFHSTQFTSTEPSGPVSSSSSSRRSGKRTSKTFRWLWSARRRRRSLRSQPASQRSVPFLHFTINSILTHSFFFDVSHQPKHVFALVAVYIFLWKKASRLDFVLFRTRKTSFCVLMVKLNAWFFDFRTFFFFRWPFFFLANGKLGLTDVKWEKWRAWKFEGWKSIEKWIGGIFKGFLMKETWRNLMKILKTRGFEVFSD